jgi:hypothetical protein
MKLNLKIVAAIGAVAMMSATSAGAAVVDTYPTAGQSGQYSLEGLQVVAGTTAVPIYDVVITLANNLTYQDDLFVSITGASTATATPPTLDCTDSNGANAVGAGFTTGYVPGGSSGSTWNFRVTDQQGATAGEKCVLTGLTVTAASLAAVQNAEVSFVAKRFILEQVLDSGSTDDLAVVASQFDVTVGTPLDGEIDVFADREDFTVADPIVSSDTLVFTTIVDNGLPVFAGSPFVDATSGTRVTIGGDFSWTDTDGDGSCTDNLGATVVPDGSLAVDTTLSDCTKMVFSLTAPNTSGPHTVVFTNAGNFPLDPQVFTGSAKYTFVQNGGSATGSTTVGFEPGAWTINGAQVYIQYMPYGTGISRIVYAANKGNLQADATAVVYANGGMFPCDLGAVNAKTVNSLSGALDTCVAANNITTGKVAILITFTAPDKDIEVYSAYNVGGNDRGTVVNTSNGRAFFYGTGFPFVPPGP